MQIASEKNVLERVSIVKNYLFKEDSIKELSKTKIFQKNDEFNLDIINIACITASQNNENIKEIDAKNLFELVSNKEFILDVREREEFLFAHVKDAINIPLRELYFRKDELPKNRNIYIYCRSAHRSLDAANFLKNLGFENTYNILGGFIDISYNEYRRDKGNLKDSILSNYNFE